MGQKVSPIGLRVGINKTWESKWFASNKDFANYLQSDEKIRKYLSKRLKEAAVSSVLINRNQKRTEVIINTAKPGVVIGHGGDEIEKLKKELNKLVNEEIQISIMEVKNIDLADKISIELNNETYLPRITSTDNGKYPYQFNKEELRKIIEHQSKYYPFLKDEVNGINKLEKILSFRIPYYVGPLDNNTNKKEIKNPNAWLIKKDENKPISIYNFDEVIDKEQTAEKFIERMIKNCTYINNEKAMPINSIFYFL